jgi:glutathione S-transferase
MLGAVMARFELYGHFISGPTYRVALMLHLCGQKFHYVHVELPAGEHKQPDFIGTKNRFGQVPALVDTQKKITVVQSGAILDYLADQLGKFGGASPAERLLAREWVFWEDDVMERGILRLRGYRIGYITAPDDVVKHYEAEGLAALSDLEGFLEHRKWLAGGKGPTYADIYVFGSVILAHEAGYDLSPFQHITRWAHHVAGLKGFGTPDKLLPQESRRAGEKPKAKPAR